MLSMNNQLTTGGNRQQRSRGTVRVNEPAYGFFVTGSSIEAMNGVYVRKNPPRARKDAAGPVPVLYYQHEEGIWHMALNELPKKAGLEEDSDEEDDDYYYYKHRQKKPQVCNYYFSHLLSGSLYGRTVE